MTTTTLRTGIDSYLRVFGELSFCDLALAIVTFLDGFNMLRKIRTWVDDFGESSPVFDGYQSNTNKVISIRCPMEYRTFLTHVYRVSNFFFIAVNLKHCLVFIFKFSVCMYESHFVQYS